MNLLTDPVQFIFWIVALLLAITVHEFMHAWTANFLGDPTAKRAGRITLNPIAHLDPLGTLMLILVRFGWGKPVPINPNNFNNPRLGSAITAIAGPTSNFLFAFALAGLYRIPSLSTGLIGEFILVAIILNLILMIFNLLPIPPLDGSKIFALFIPGLDNPKFEIYGPIILIAFIFLGGSTFLGPIVNFFLNILGVNLNIF